LKYFPTLFGVVAASVLLLDQTSKALVSATLYMHQVVPVLDGLFNLTRVHNTGAAFGLLAGKASVLRTLFFLGVSLAAMSMVLWLARGLRAGQKIECVALALIFGGALGNVVDRLRLGEVIDFIDLHYRGLHWPAFNVADSAISTGVVILLWRLLFAKK